jgi:fluoride exporter
MIYPALIPIGYVAAGGAIGSVLRYVAVQVATQLHGGGFPAGTMLVNVVGSFIIGLLMSRYMQADSESARFFLVTGVLGGFTTFSAFSWDALQMLQRGALGSAAFYVGGSVILSLVAVAAGYAMGR